MVDMQVNVGKDRPVSNPGSSITLFLSLYLLVLAFFILLVSISSVEEVKSKALMDSLTSTFSAVLPPRMDLTTFNATTGDILAADEFQRQVTGLFSTVIGVEKIDTIQPGRLMRVELDGDGLFETDKAVVRESQSPFMDRLVAALSASPPGLRFEMEFVAPTPWLKNKTLPSDQQLATRRAGAFARNLLARGAPPGSVSIGLKGSKSTTMEIWFHIRGVDENRINFENSPLIKVPEAASAQPAAPVQNAPVTLQPVTNSSGAVSLPLGPVVEPTQPLLQQQPVQPNSGPVSLQPRSLQPNEGQGNGQ